MADSGPHSGGDPAHAVEQAAAQDAVLVRRVHRGDMEAYGALVRRHTRRAYSIAYGILHHRQDAEDVVQDAFARALERIDDMDPGRPFHPWFSRIVMNTAFSFRRSRAIRRTSALPDDAHSTDASPERLLERSELRARLLRALDALPARQRAIVLLADVEELSSAEIGEIMELPAGTVRYHLHLARRALRQTLSAADEEVR